MIYEIGGGTGVYCIEGAGPRVYYVAYPEPMLIDTGGPGQTEIVLRALAQIGVQPISIRRIVLTHHHLGHVGGVAELKRRSGANVYAHVADIPYISGRLRRRAPRNRVERVLNSAVAWTGVMDVPPARIEKPVDEGMVVNGWQILHTPGHTPGHICLLRDRMLISGDLLQASAGGFREMSLSSIADIPASRASIAKIANLSFDAILSAHHAPYVMNANGKVQELAARLDRSVD
ncbi:MAG: MBL fold metallo-hydrolase [Anaerolineae bacterium]